MTIKKSCNKCKHFIVSTKECSNIEAEYYMINGISDYKKGCDKHEDGECDIE